MPQKPKTFTVQIHGQKIPSQHPSQGPITSPVEEMEDELIALTGKEQLKVSMKLLTLYCTAERVLIFFCRMTSENAFYLFHEYVCCFIQCHMLRSEFTLENGLILILWHVVMNPWISIFWKCIYQTLVHFQVGWVSMFWLMVQFSFISKPGASCFLYASVQWRLTVFVSGFSLACSFWNCFLLPCLRLFIKAVLMKHNFLDMKQNLALCHC